MIAGNRFVIWGLSRITTRVARMLADRKADVVVVRGDEGSALLSLLDGVRLQDAGNDQEEALRAAGLSGARCLLALADDDLSNVRAAVAAHAIAPDVPVVLRCDPILAEHIEEALNVRRAFSVSALAAPTLVASVLGGDVLETVRLGDAEALLCRLSVGPKSPFVGMSARRLKREHHCGILALADADGAWRTTIGEQEEIAAGESLVVGGLLADVLELARLNSGLVDRPKRRGWFARRRTAPPHPYRATLMPRVALLLVLVLLVCVGVMFVTHDLSLLDALSLTLHIAFGNLELDPTLPGWLKIFECGVLLCGGALIGVVFSHLASVATAERLELQMGRAAQRMRGHVVVAGLGNVGYRVVRILGQLGIPTVVIEAVPNVRFSEALRHRAVVLAGDVRLAENLERAGIENAVALVACTNNDLTNIQACLQGRKLNPTLRTVARVFDDQLAERLTSAFAINAAISPSRAVAGAFVGAATDERAVRACRVGDRTLLAFRHEVTAAVTVEEIASWRAAGIRMLAFRRGGETVQRPSALEGGLAPGDAVVVAGAEETVRSLLLAQERAG